jgi:uncharacterized Fe-S cluster protein YjdI
MKHNIKKEYSNGIVTIKWDPDKCIHSGICKNGLPHIFKPMEKPWIQMGDTNSETIVEQVKKCPSGALLSHYNNEKK